MVGSDLAVLDPVETGALGSAVPFRAGEPDYVVKATLGPSSESSSPLPGAVEMHESGGQKRRVVAKSNGVMNYKGDNRQGQFLWLAATHLYDPRASFRLLPKTKPSGFLQLQQRLGKRKEGRKSSAERRR